MTKRASKEYIEQLKKTHEDESWGTTAGKWAPSILGIVEEYKTDDIIDYGCGKGELELTLPMHVKKYDVGVKKYSEPPAPADILVSIDVLEHIEPDCLDDVLKHMASLMKKVGFLLISTVPAIKHLPDGRNAHLIVWHSDTWLMKLLKYFKIKSFRRFEGHSCLAIVEPKDKDMDKIYENIVKKTNEMMGESDD